MGNAFESKLLEYEKGKMMYSITQPPPLSGLSDTPQQSFNLWLWLGIGAGAYMLFKKPKRKPSVLPLLGGTRSVQYERESLTPSDLHGLSALSTSNPHVESYNELVKIYNKAKRQILHFYSSERLSQKEVQHLEHDLEAAKYNNIRYILKQGKFVPEGELKAHPELRKHIAEQMTLFGGLSGNLRTCDAWFETTDKKGRLIHRCFIYKPTCSPKRCKVDPNVSRETISEMQGVDSVLGELSAPINYKKYPIENALDWFKYLKSKNVLKPEEEIKATGMLTRATNKIPFYGNGISAMEYIESLYDKYFPSREQMTLFGKLSGYTATCRTWKRDKLGRRHI